MLNVAGAGVTASAWAVKDGLRDIVREAAPAGHLRRRGGLLASALVMWWWAERRLRFRVPASAGRLRLSHNSDRLTHLSAARLHDRGRRPGSRGADRRGRPPAGTAQADPQRHDHPHQEDDRRQGRPLQADAASMASSIPGARRRRRPACRGTRRRRARCCRGRCCSCPPLAGRSPRGSPPLAPRAGRWQSRERNAHPQRRVAAGKSSARADDTEPAGNRGDQGVADRLPPQERRVSIGASNVSVRPARSIANWFIAIGRIDISETNDANDASPMPPSQVSGRNRARRRCATSAAKMPNTTIGDSIVDRPRGVRSAEPELGEGDRGRRPREAGEPPPLRGAVRALALSGRAVEARTRSNTANASREGPRATPASVASAVADDRAAGRRRTSGRTA